MDAARGKPSPKRAEVVRRANSESSTRRLLRRRPRSYAEWSALARWGRLPPWEPTVPGYLLRQARESAGLTQAEMAERLGVTQQAVARAERADANPSFRLLEAWAEALGSRIRLEIEPEPR